MTRSPARSGSSLSSLARGFAPFGLALTLAAQAPLPPQRTLADLLPPSTYAVLEFDGIAACRAAADQLPVASALRHFLAGLPAGTREGMVDEQLVMAGEEVRAELAGIGLAPGDVRAALARPMALAVGRLTIEGYGPSVALLVDVAEDAAAVANCVGALRRGLQAQGDLRGERSGVDVGGHALACLDLAEGPPIYHGVVGTTYVVTNSRGLVREITDVAAGKAPSLVTTTRLGELRAQFGARPIFSGFYNIGAVLSMLAPHLPYEAADFADALGIGGIDALYAAYGAGAEGGADFNHIGVGGSHQGLAKVLLATPVDLAFARACSPDTVAFAAGSLDVPGAIAAVRRFLALLPAEPRREAERGLARAMRQLAREFGHQPGELDALVRAFGTQFGVAFSLAAGAVPKPELLVHVGVRDPEVVQQLLQGLEQHVAQGVGLEFRSRDVDGTTVRFVNVRLPEAELQISPSYALHGESLWIASDVATLVKALRQSAGDAGESLAAQEDFRLFAARVHGASGALHLRLFRAAQLGWRAVEQFGFPFVDAHADEIGFGSEALPDAETVAKALGTHTVAFHVDDRGVTVRSQGTLGFGALYAGLGAALDHVLEAATGKSH
jgi:hypothetical protein